MSTETIIISIISASVPLVISIVGFATVFGILKGRTKTNMDEIGHLFKRYEKIEDRTRILETSFAGFESQVLIEIKNINVNISDLKGDIKIILEKFKNNK